MKSRKAVISPPLITRIRARRSRASKRSFNGAFYGALVLVALACTICSLPSAAALRRLRSTNQADAGANMRHGVAVSEAKRASVPSVRRATAAGPELNRLAPPQLTLFPALMLPAPPPPTGEVIETFAADCTTPQDVFNLGDTICAKVTNAPTFSLFALRRISWVNTGGLILQQNNVLNSSDTFTFTLPTTATTADGLDRRGGWAVNSISTADSSVHAQARFTVRDPNNAAANLSVLQFAQGGEAVVAAGAHITYTVVVANHGPDDAHNVQLTEGDPTLNNTGTAPTFVSSSQLSGPAFTCSSDTNCSIATLPVGAAATFAFIYDTAASTANYTVISETASVTSDTNETNAADNSSTAFATVIGVSTATECTLDCPNDMTVTANTTQNGVSGAIVNFGAADAVGDCGTVTTSHPSGSFFPLGTTVVTSTSSLGGGSCSFNITVVEAGGPTISCPANVSQHITTGCETQINPGTPTASAGATVTADRSDDQQLSDPFPVGTTTILWTATDNLGRTASCTQTVTITNDDTTPPTITAPPDVTVSTGPGAGACGIILTEAQLGRADADDPGGCSVSVAPVGVPAGNFFPIGTTTVTWKATDASGNTATATQQVTVTDDTPPVIFAPPDATYTCPSEVPAADPAQATGPDVLDANCGVATVTVSETRSGAGSASSPLIITRTFTATDSHGNHADAVQTITVIDSTPPTVSAPANITVSNDPGVCSATLDPGTATAQDNCAGATVSGARSDGQPLNAPYPKGTTTITWTATDAAGNTATAPQTVTVNDTEKPVLQLPANIVVGTDPGVCSAVVNFTVTATDNCAGTTVTTSVPSGTTFPKGTTTVTATATDASGNTSTGSFTVTVNDTEAPKITLNGQTLSMWPPNHRYNTFQVTSFVTGVSDNCDTGLSVSNVVIENVTSDEIENGNGDGNTMNDIVIAADCKSVQLRAEREGNGNGRVYTITFKVRDEAGNVGRATAKVVVARNRGEAPIDSGVHYTVNGSCP
jgi:hypothetical protein